MTGTQGLEEPVIFYFLTENNYREEVFSFFLSKKIQKYKIGLFVHKIVRNSVFVEKISSMKDLGLQFYICHTFHPSNGINFSPRDILGWRKKVVPRQLLLKTNFLFFFAGFPITFSLLFTHSKTNKKQKKKQKKTEENGNRKWSMCCNVDEVPLSDRPT